MVLVHCMSFASNPRSKQWSKLNGDITPRQVSKTSKKKYIFDCKKCKHQFETALVEINRRNSWCPYCANQKLCDDVCDGTCNTCFNKTIAANYRAEFWSKENTIDPQFVFRGSKTKYKFDCTECKHQFEITPSDISYNDNWCPYCINHKLCDDQNCEYCFNNSIASHPKSIYWNDNNILEPRQVCKTGGLKYKFDCPHCNKIYVSTPANVTAGHWCPCIVNKTEAKLYDYLQTLYDTVSKSAKFNWCKNIRCLPFDICIEKFKLLIEVDGPQHFRQISNWTSAVETQNRDIYKMQCANANGYTVIRIMQEDVWYDRNNWKEELGKVIGHYEKPINVFVGQKIIDIAKLSLSPQYLNCFHSPFTLNDVVWI